MKLELSRNEVPFIISGLSQLKGMKDWKKAIALGDDLRKLRKIQKETEAAAKMCKPEKYDELAIEFQERCKKKAAELGEQEGELLNDSEIGSHVMLIWKRSMEWTTNNRHYQEAINELSAEMIEIDLQTEKLSEEDFEKKAIDSSLGEVLSYFR
ncbi:MAG TPA: hypothetical protein DCL77_09030 [Prolixibacteraceae bacterium]|jgi:DNA repair ATPase RecN|nr:hypothetical protein [Prolixibacteraceae bacterium]